MTEKPKIRDLTPKAQDVKAGGTAVGNPGKLGVADLGDIVAIPGIIDVGDLPDG